MKRLAYLLIVAGVSTAIIAFNLDVTIGDSGITNMNLMAQRQNFLIVGCVGFLAGVVLLVGGLQRDNLTKNQGGRNNVGSDLVEESRIGTSLNFFKKQDLGGKVILTSIFSILLSFCFPWEILSLGSTSGGYVVNKSPIELSTGIIAALLWIYPCYVVMTKNKINSNVLAFNAVLAGIWIAVIAYRFWRWHTYAAEQLAVYTNNGTGFWLALLASTMLIIGAFKRIK